ncbi:Coiled-coil protein [Entamoeba marina]
MQSEIDPSITEEISRLKNQLKELEQKKNQVLSEKNAIQAKISPNALKEILYKENEEIDVDCEKLFESFTSHEIDTKQFIEKYIEQRTKYQLNDIIAHHS